MIGHVLAAVQAMEPQRVVAVVGTSASRSAPTSWSWCPTWCSRSRRPRRAPGTPSGSRWRRSGDRSAAPSSWSPATPRCCEGESLRAFAEEHEAAAARGQHPDRRGGRPVRLRPGRPQRRGRRRGDRRGEGRHADEQREIGEINSGILAFDGGFLAEALPRIGNDNAKGEYYLTDIVGIARDDGLTVGAHAIDDVMQTEGANDRAQLAALGRELNRRIVDPVDARRRDRDGPRDHLDRRRRGARPRT